MLRSAMLQGFRPTTFLLRKQPHSKWSDDDFIYAEAYQIHEDETSSSSGLPIWITRRLDQEVIFRIEERVDNADRALEEWDASHQGKKRAKGMSRFAIAVDGNNEPVDFGGWERERYYKDIPLDEEMIDDDIDIDRIRPAGGYDPSEYGDGLVESGTTD